MWNMQSPLLTHFADRDVLDELVENEILCNMTNGWMYLKQWSK